LHGETIEKDLVDDIKSGIKEKALVFGTNIGAEILKIPAIRIYTEINAQVDAILAFYERFNADFLITAMGLSVEAECFGSEIVFSQNEAPQVLTVECYDPNTQCPLCHTQNIHIPIITNPTPNRIAIALTHPNAISLEDWAALRQSFKRMISMVINTTMAAINPPKGGKRMLNMNAAPVERKILKQEAPLFFALALIKI